MQNEADLVRLCRRIHEVQRLPRTAENRFRLGRLRDCRENLERTIAAIRSRPEFGGSCRGSAHPKSLPGGCKVKARIEYQRK